ncbi:MAG TPA: hypothetical protein VEF06_06425 [Bryobacteraceae bacterium]|nr:hypothetical protein [Bryobacteraceae bacterium]
MKRKSPARTESAVAPEILEQAQRSVASDRIPAEPRLSVPPKRVPRCVVCNGEASSATPEQLCWVCRRLKISAWREVEQQAPAQE